MQQLQCKDRHRAIAIKWRFNSIEPIFLSGPLDSFIGDFILNNHLVEKDTSDLHLKGTLHSSPVFFLAVEYLKIVSISRSSSLQRCYSTSMTITTKQRGEVDVAENSQPSRWYEAISLDSSAFCDAVCVLCANQFAFSHNRKASSNSSPSFFNWEIDFYLDYIYDVLVLNHR